MGLFFNFMINYFNDKLDYDYDFKSIYLIGAVLSGFILYLLISIFIKAFKMSDINLKY